METLTVKQFSSEAEKIISTIRSRKNLVLLTQNDKPAVIVQSAKEFEKERRAYLFLKLMAESEKEIKTGKLTSHKKIFSDIRKRHSRKNEKV